MKRKKVVAPPPRTVPASPSSSVLKSFPSGKRLSLLVSLFAFLLYAQTLTFQYALDDQPVIRENALVQKGIAAIPELLSSDFWRGSSVGISIPLYRPASLVLFALEWQFFPDSPAVYHFVNVALYACSIGLLFLLLRRLFKGKSLFIPLACSLLFAAHPLHTEVVSNIKSADEILCFLFILLAAWASLNYVERKSWTALAAACLFFFMALLSKESGIVLFAVVPLMLYFFTPAGLQTNIRLLLAFLVPAGFYFLIRYRVLQDIPSYDTSPLVNTLYAAPDWIVRKATAVYILLLYIGLLLFPHPLSYTYDFNQVKIQDPASAGVLLSVVIHLALLGLAIAGFRKKKVVSFAILFYLVTLAPVSNIFLTIGSPMAERFLYIPSLGFCLAAGAILYNLSKRSNKPELQVWPRYAGLAVLVVSAVYSIKTFSRSRDWENNVSLFGRDVKVAPESAPARLHWGNALVSIVYERTADESARRRVLDQAEAEYLQAIRIFPDYLDAYLHLGDVYAKKSDIPHAILYFEKYNSYAPGTNTTVLQYLGGLYDKAGQYDRAMDAWKGVARNSGGRDHAAYYYIGLLHNKRNEYTQALPYLDSALHLEPSYLLARKNKALALLNLNETDRVMAECDTLLSYDANYAKAYCYKGFACLQRKDYRGALGYLEKAMQLDPADKECESRLVILRNMSQAGTL